MAQYIDKDTLTEKLWERRVKNHDFGGSPYSEYGYEDDEILSLIDTLEVIEIGVDLGDPKGDKSAKYIIDTNTLEVKEVDLEKEINTQWNKFVDSEGEVEQFSEIAKHFFELGMAVGNKAKKGE